MKQQDSSPPESILYFNFNTDHTCFCVGTNKGFEIWNVSPCKLRYARELGGIGIVEMVDKSNILALVGGGSSPAYAKNKVMIWDDSMRKVIAELEFRSQVSLVRIYRSRILVATYNKIYVYCFSDLSLLYSSEIQEDTGYMLAYSDKVLAYPSLKSGHVQVHFEKASLNLPPFRAHDHKIGFLCWNREATLLATASSQGTVIKIFNGHTSSTRDGHTSSTRDGHTSSVRKSVAKLRRGKDPAKITHMSFSSDSEWLCVCSDKGTIHIFNVLDSSKSQKSSMNFIADLSILPSGLQDYVKSEFSFAQIHCSDNKSIAVFDTQVANQVNVLSSDGRLTFYSFDIEYGGEARKEFSYIYKHV
ncbi:WD40-repeat domain-containing protein [Cedratvirus Zaza IHUMI]|uniref:WD40-repeat domain-containing protein n=1 Tax=Cedratvirus Zaza IHUMI TaxID=2126979 RepID=A0A2R8FFW6_9VIRU|nr:WD40-repeat domain-containing protein [Cedratvirus Zaza IHUMI]